MTDVDVRIYCGLNGAPPKAEPISRTITLAEEDEDLFFPRTSDKWDYWPRRKEAENLICSILKEELFPDEITPIEDENDLRRLGVTFLKVAFDNKNNHMGSTFIEPN